MRKPVNVTWEDRPSSRIVSIEWDCGCHVYSETPVANVICPEHRRKEG